MSQQQDRSKCDVGDWVLASSAPDWSLTQLTQIFSPEGPRQKQRPEEWVFLGSFFLDHSGEPVPIWRRRS